MGWFRDWTNGASKQARKKPSQAPSPGPTPLSSEQYVSPKPLLPSAVKATIVDESADAFSPDGLSGHTSGVSTSGALIADSGLPSAKEQRTPNSKWASRSSGSFPTITNSSSQLGSVVEDIEQTEWSKAREVLEGQSDSGFSASNWPQTSQAKEEQEFRTNEEASRHILQEMDYQLGSKMDELLGRGVDAMKLNNQASPWPAEDPLWHPFLGSDNGSGCRDRHAHRGMGLTSREPRSGPDVSQGATTSRGTNVLFGSPSDLVGKSELSQHSFPSYKTTDLINKAIFGRQSHQAASRDQTQFNRQYSDGSSLGSPSSTTSCTQLRHVPRPSALKLVDITGSLGSPGDRTESPKGFTSPRLTRSSYDMLSPGSLRIAKLAKSGSFGPLTDGTSKGVGYQELLHKYSNRLNIPMLTSGDGSFRTQRSFGAHTRSYGAGNGSVKTRQASCITLRVPPSSTSVREPSKSNSNTRNNSTTRAAAPLETHLSIRSLCSIPASARPSPSVSAASKPRSSSHSTTIAGSYGPIQASGFSTVSYPKVPTSRPLIDLTALRGGRSHQRMPDPPSVTQPRAPKIGLDCNMVPQPTLGCTPSWQSKSPRAIPTETTEHSKRIGQFKDLSRAPQGRSIKTKNTTNMPATSSFLAAHHAAPSSLPAHPAASSSLAAHPSASASLAAHHQRSSTTLPPRHSASHHAKPTKPSMVPCSMSLPQPNTPASQPPPKSPSKGSQATSQAKPLSPWVVHGRNQESGQWQTLHLRSASVGDGERGSLEADAQSSPTRDCQTSAPHMDDGLSLLASAKQSKVKGYTSTETFAQVTDHLLHKSLEPKELSFAEPSVLIGDSEPPTATPGSNNMRIRLSSLCNTVDLPQVSDFGFDYGPAAPPGLNTMTSIDKGNSQAQLEESPPLCDSPCAQLEERSPMCDTPCAQLDERSPMCDSLYAQLEERPPLCDSPCAQLEERPPLCDSPCAQLEERPPLCDSPCAQLEETSPTCDTPCAQLDERPPVCNSPYAQLEERPHVCDTPCTQLEERPPLCDSPSAQTTLSNERSPFATVSVQPQWSACDPSRQRRAFQPMDNSQETVRAVQGMIEAASNSLAPGGLLFSSTESSISSQGVKGSTSRQEGVPSPPVKCSTSRHKGVPCSPGSPESMDKPIFGTSARSALKVAGTQAPVPPSPLGCPILAHDADCGVTCFEDSGSGPTGSADSVDAEHPSSQPRSTTPPSQAQPPELAASAQLPQDCVACATPAVAPGEAAEQLPSGSTRAVPRGACVPDQAERSIATVEGGQTVVDAPMQAPDVIAYDEQDKELPGSPVAKVGCFGRLFRCK